MKTLEYQSRDGKYQILGTWVPCGKYDLDRRYACFEIIEDGDIISTVGTLRDGKRVLRALRSEYPPRAGGYCRGMPVVMRGGHWRLVGR